MLNPSSATFPLYLPVLFALSLEFLCAILSLKKKLEAALALHKDTILQRFPALRSPNPSGITSAIVPPPKVVGSVSGRERPKFSEADTNLGIPSPISGEGKVLPLQVGIHNLSPETRTWRNSDEDSLIQLVKTGLLEDITKDQELHQGSTYIHFEDYHSSGLSNPLTAQLYDQCRSTGTYEYFICQLKDQTNLVQAC